MSKIHKIYDWEDWVELCEEHDEDPHKIADLSLPARRQISGGDTEDYEYCGLYPEEEEDPEPLVQWAMGHFVRVGTKHADHGWYEWDGFEIFEGTDTFFVNQMIKDEDFDI